jgi:glutamate-1-semialdehyde 2,1-aminomutase
VIPGFTSTGSKRPEALFGAAQPALRMSRANGCRLWDESDREYLDMVMALGTVALGYAHPDVTEAAERAMRDGGVGSLAPSLEPKLAERLAAVLPGVEAMRFFKTGAEAVAAAVRIARVHTGREHVITCGYQGWLDWCSSEAGVPAVTRALRRTVPFNDVSALETAFVESPPVAAVVLEPVVAEPPEDAWLQAAQRLCRAQGAVLVFDEIKTAFRVARGGIAEERRVTPDLMVVGKALGNGFPIAAVGGHASLMEAATRTWISSTLASELVSIAAALAVLDVFERDGITRVLAERGDRLWYGLDRLCEDHRDLVTDVRGIPQMCHLEFVDDVVSGWVARAALERGVLFKRSAYNFVSAAHENDVIDDVLVRLDDALSAVSR